MFGAPRLVRLGGSSEPPIFLRRAQDCGAPPHPGIRVSDNGLREPALRLGRPPRLSRQRGDRFMNLNTIIYIVGLVVVIGFVLSLLGVY